MADSNKDTIYIDIDDEITAIIDKVRASSGKVVALVLPKRATTLQSIVNMKLLKRSADEGKKNLVLITTETGLLPLAGAVGLHVAKTPSSRPEIPPAPAAFDDSEEQVDETADLLGDDDDETEATAENAGNMPVGVLAGAAAGAAVASRPAPASGIETVELDNVDATTAAAAGAAKTPKKPKVKKDKKLAVPNFDRFRMLLIFGAIGLVALVVLGYIMFSVLPKATINVSTNASNVNTNVDFTLSTSATTLNASTSTVPAKQASVQKTLTGTATATGQKNNGQKATGNVTISLADCDKNVVTVPAGSAVSSNGLTYITGASITLESVKVGNNCNPSSFSSTYSKTVKITAQLGGAKYNMGSGTPMTVSSGSGYTSSDLKATSSTIDGGTDDIQTVVSQADIDSAKGKIATGDNTAQEELKNQLEGQGLYAITATYAAGTPTTTNSSEAGSAATSVTVTQVITYTMLGAAEADIKTLVDNDIKGQIDTNNQSILTEGITQSAFKVKEATSTGAKMNIQTTAEVGPDLSTDEIAKNAAGKKSSQIQSDVKSNPDVTDVEVKLSPFWVTKAPKNVEKITVNIAKPTKTANAE